MARQVRGQKKMSREDASLYDLLEGRGEAGSVPPTADNPFGFPYNDVQAIDAVLAKYLTKPVTENEVLTGIPDTRTVRERARQRAVDTHANLHISLGSVLERDLQVEVINILKKEMAATGLSLAETLNFICYQYEDLRGSKLPELTKLNKELKNIKDE